MQPLVSIIIPTFNRAHLISETLDSVLEQSYLNWECIIVDDGSTDCTIDVLKHYAAKDFRFKWFVRPSYNLKGASSCRNYGFEISTGIFIQYLDSDDVISKNKLESQVFLLENTSFSTFSTCKWGFKQGSNKGEILSGLSIYKDFLTVTLFMDSLSNSKGYMPIHNYMFHRELVLKIGIWNENLTINDDGEFMTRIFVNSNKVLFSDNSYVFYRVENNDSLSSLNSNQKLIDLINSWRLIEAIIFIRYKKQNSLFLNSNKNILFKNLIIINSNLVFENKDFFKLQIQSSGIFTKIRCLFFKLRCF